jgi:hypothetical protein
MEQSSLTRRWVNLLVMVAILVTLAQHITVLSRPLNYQHAWGVAGAALHARTFRSQGMFHLWFVPIHNNPPYGLHPEVYVHWPPLQAIVVTLWTDFFGESESSIHSYALALYVVTSALFFAMIWVLGGRLAAPLGLLVWLTLPVAVKYSHVVYNEGLGLPFVLIAIIAFCKASRDPSQTLWRRIGAGATVLSVLSNWEWCLVPVGLIAGSLWSRDKIERRLAILYFGCAAGTVVAVLGFYGLAYPDPFRDTLHTFLYRVGLSSSYSGNPLHNLAPTTLHFTLYSALRTEVRHLNHMIGGLGLLALAVFLAIQFEHYRETNARYHSLSAICGMLAPPIIWFVVFSNHVAIHEFECILLAPATVFAMVWCAMRLFQYLEGMPVTGARARYWGLLIAGPLLLMAPLFMLFHQTVEWHGTSMKPNPEIMQPDEFVEFGREIRTHAPENAVVLTPEMHLVPVYYSWRHLEGGIMNDQDLDKVMPIIRSTFPGSPVYLAILNKDRGHFSKALGPNVPSITSESTIVRIVD